MSTATSVVPGPVGRPQTRPGDPLPKRQGAVFGYIKRYVREHDYPPTVREIQVEFGIGSPNGVMCHIRGLDRRGLIARRARAARSIRVLDWGDAGDAGEEDATQERGGPAAPTPDASARDASARDASPPTAYHTRLIARARRVASWPNTSRDAAALLAELAEALEGRRDA